MRTAMPQLNYAGEPPVILGGEREPDLAAYLATLLEQRWLIAAVALAVTLAGTLYAFLAPSVYESTLMVQVEEKGQREPKNILGEAGAIIDYKTPASAEIELLRSRLVVSRAVDRLGLCVDVRPQRFPVLGQWAAALNLDEAMPILRGLGGYAWGDEAVQVDAFTVPAYLENRAFELQALGRGHYRVSEPESGILFGGEVGEAQTHVTRFGPITLHLAQLDAAAGTRFTLVRRSRLAAIDGVQKSLSVAEIGKQSGVVVATLKAGSADEAHRLLSAIGDEYMAQNSARRTEEADKSLAWLNQRLPEVRQQLEQAEARYNQFRNAHGTVDLGEEGRINLQRSAAARTRKLDLEQKRSELLARYTPAHPAVAAIDQQLAEVNRELRDAAGQLRQLPVLEQELVRLARDVKVNNELHTALLTSAQQLQLIAVGRTGNVRLVDAPARPESPVMPNRPRIMAAALFAGVFLGVLLAFLRRALQTAMDDPEEVERLFGLPVYASIPHSRMQKTLDVNRRDPTRLAMLSRVASMDIAVEGLRNFRTALQFCMSHGGNNVVLITGPTEGMGKSFVSANLASIMAASGKRVLLIDADLRDGQLHRFLHAERTGGLAEILCGAPPLQLLRPALLDHLDFIATGVLPPNPSELLLRPAFGEMLAQLSPHYDVVLIDAAPLLAVADSLVIGAHAGAIFLVARAGVTRPGEIGEAMKRLARAGLAAKGVVFNDVSQRPGRYGYGSRYGYGRFRQLGYTDDAPRPADA